MFNFLRTSASMQNARIMSTRSTAQCSMPVCSFCNFHHLGSPIRPTRYTLLRHYATTDTVELHAPWKKKIKRRSKKYAELLEVTNQTTNSRKAAVHKLNSAHVSVLVGQPDVTLDKLHKISNFHLDKKATSTQAKDTKADSRKNLAYTEDKTDNVHCNILKESDEYLKDKSTVVEDLKEYAMSDNTTLIKDSSFLDTLQIDKDVNKDKNQDDVLTQMSSKYDEVPNPSTAITVATKKDHYEDSLSSQNLISQLRAHMDVYIQIEMPSRAFKILMLNRDQLKRSNISAVTLYNLLMETYVSNARLEKVLEIYRLMRVNSVQPNPRTYALMFEMIGRMKNDEKRTDCATEVATDMSRGGVSFDDVMNTRMNATQRDIVLRCIQFLDPQYRVQYRDIDSTYNCKLLRNLMVASNYQSPAKGVVGTELRDMVRTQVEMERQCELEVKSIAPFTGDSDVRQQAIERIAEWEKSWKTVVTHAFERNLAYQKQKELMMKPDFKALHPFLQVLPKEEYINAILREINQLARFSDAYSISMTNLYLTLGKYIYKKYQFQRKLKAGVIENSIRIYEKYLEWYMRKKPVNSVNGRVRWQQLAQEANRSGICSEMMVPEWPRNVLLNVGEFLYKIILNDVKIPHVSKPDASERQIPAFYLLFRKQTNHFLTEEIKPHPYLHRLYKDSHPETLTFETILLPTCSPPRPWIDINTGGYLFSKAAFIRDSYMTPTILLKNTPTRQLYPALDCLNQLGSIPWRINVPILDILIRIFREGGSEKLDVPQPPSALPSLSELISSSDIDKSKISKLALQLRRRKNEMYSLWCDCLYKLSLANHFRDKVFWLPHNLDFRGRAYPVPPHLTHLAADLGRSILMFAQGKALGPKGLDWLKIHAINLTGLKKREPIDQRLKFANEMLDLIVDSARNPLSGDMWWTKSDEPWQTLAACKEIDNALQSPNVEKYVCRLPIHQDGSCNGLQHYAALGRDQIGAESVNLYPSNSPQDVYSVIAAMVDEYRKLDAEAGDEVAKALEGYVTRKVIKQTVMTTVYGVTKFGGRLQIARQLSDLKEFNQDYTWNGSLYLVEKTFQSLRTMFTSAKEIQDWFTECARVISTRCNQYVQWVTPLGLPVLQPYFKRIKSSSQNKLIRKPDTLKQKNAFPPNFIHSLDSSHMMLTSLYCEQAGITFMSIHDCFWTHACTVDIMNRICREQFIELHCEPILEDLSEFLCKRYKKHFTSGQRLVKQRDSDLSLEVFKKLPKKGDFDIHKVQSSRYFFS